MPFQIEAMDWTLNAIAMNGIETAKDMPTAQLSVSLHGKMLRE